MTGKYKAIFFDLDGTLLDFNASERTAIKRVLKLHNLPCDEASAQLYSQINKSFWEAFERGEIKREEIFEGRFKVLLQKLGLNGDTAKIADDYFYCLSEGHDLMDGAVDILGLLKAKGYRLYATTNGVTRTQIRRIKDAGIEAYFEGVFISEQIGFQKPQREYFDYILSQIPSIKREETLIIGDSQSSDILGGINAGIDTCWFAPEDKEGEYTPNYKISSLYEIENIL